MRQHTRCNSRSHSRALDHSQSQPSPGMWGLLSARNLYRWFLVITVLLSTCYGGGSVCVTTVQTVPSSRPRLDRDNLPARSMQRSGSSVTGTVARYNYVDLTSRFYLVTEVPLSVKPIPRTLSPILGIPRDKPPPINSISRVCSMRANSVINSDSDVTLDNQNPSSTHSHSGVEYRDYLAMSSATIHNYISHSDIEV